MRRLRRLKLVIAVAAGLLAAIARAAVQTLRQRRRRGERTAAGAVAATGADERRTAGDSPPPEEDGERPAAHLPAPSVWPVVVALGITLLLLGVVTKPAFSAVGLAVTAWAIGGWIGELRHERA